MGYIFSGMGILDFIVCLPFLGIFFGMDWQIVYSMRIIRVLAIFKLARFNRTAENFRQAFLMIRDEFFLFFAVILFLLYITSLGIYMAEHEAQPEKFSSFFDALWFAVETVSTVGYGDLVPITPMGRIYTGIVMFIALSLIAVSTGLITSAFSQVWQQEHSLLRLRRKKAAALQNESPVEHPTAPASGEVTSLSGGNGA
jgi:voltage-gated potassium channel